MGETTYSSYRKLYKQSFTIPLGPAARYVGNVPIDFGHIATFGVLVFIIAILYSLLLGKSIILGFGRPIWSMILALPITYYLYKIDTVGQPLHTFLAEVLKFPFRKHMSVSFLSFERPKNINMRANVKYRPVVSYGNETGFLTLPVEGVTNKIEGLHMITSGATRLEINPLTKQMQIKVGQYDKINPVIQEIRRFRKTVIEVGKGDVRFLHRNGKVQVSYEPKLGQERGG